MTIDEKIAVYDEMRKRYQDEIQERMSEEQYREYGEILFSAHSCAIEGNSFTVDDTRTLKELGLGMVPSGRKLFECLEMVDHFKAFEYVFNSLQHPLNEELLKETNRLVTQNTLTYKAPDAVPGEYTTEDMVAGDTVFGNHERLIAQVPHLLESTEKALQGNAHPMIVAARFHGYFEYLHPFRDGNGRTGRLISNYILLRKGHPLLVIYKEERNKYIAALRQIRTEGTDEHLTHFFLDCAISHMREAMNQKRHNSRLMSFLF